MFEKISTLLSGDKGRQQKEMVGELASILISVVSTLAIMIMIIIILISVVSTLAIFVMIIIILVIVVSILQSPTSS